MEFGEESGQGLFRRRQTEIAAKAAPNAGAPQRSEHQPILQLSARIRRCASTKAALELLSDALYQEVSPLGIKVMVVEPGAFRTRFFDDSLKGTQVKIGDYAETAGKTRKENIQNRHDQPGDPDRGGKIIVETIQREDYPRTLLLGSGAVRFVEKQLRHKLDEISKWASVSAQSDFVQ